MKKVVTSSKIFPFILSFLVLIIPSFVFAQSGKSISGDEVCGGLGNPCDLKDFVNVTKSAVFTIIGLGLPLLIVFVSYRFVMAWFALQQGNSNAYKEALKKSFQATIGFLVIVALIGGAMFVLLKYIGVKDEPLQILKLFSFFGVEYVYAAEGKYLPNFLGVDNLYDFLLQMVRLVMRFVIFPAVIAIWTWTGFQFVYAQGKPEELNKARKWFFWAFLTTLFIFSIQALLMAAQSTVKSILPNTEIQDASSGTKDGRVAPKDGEPGSSCEKDGLSGRITTEGICNTSSRR